jgi:hypothetical protein
MLTLTGDGFVAGIIVQKSQHPVIRIAQTKNRDA